MRNQGSLRLILNSKLWAQMEVQRANHKNLRIMATDLEDYSIKVFLIQVSKNFSDQGLSILLYLQVSAITNLFYFYFVTIACIIG